MTACGSVCVRVKCSLTLSTCLSNELAVQQNHGAVRQDRKFQAQRVLQCLCKMHRMAVARGAAGAARAAPLFQLFFFFFDLMTHSSHNECLWTRGLWSPSSRSFFVVRRRRCRDSVRITTVTVRAPTFRSKLTLHAQMSRHVPMYSSYKSEKTFVKQADSAQNKRTANEVESFKKKDVSN